jgi:hypothetical protein
MIRFQKPFSLSLDYTEARTVLTPLLSSIKSNRLIFARQ